MTKKFEEGTGNVRNDDEAPDWKSRILLGSIIGMIVAPMAAIGIGVALSNDSSRQGAAYDHEVSRAAKADGFDKASDVIDGNIGKLVVGKCKFFNVMFNAADSSISDITSYSLEGKNAAYEIGNGSYYNVGDTDFTTAAQLQAALDINC